MNQINKNGKKASNPYSSTTTTAKTGLIIAIIATLLALLSMSITVWNWNTVLRLHSASKSNENKINQTLITNTTKSDTILSELQSQIKEQQSQQHTVQSQVDQLVTLTNSSSQLQKKQQVIALLQTADLQLSITKNVATASQLLKKANTQLKTLSLNDQLATQQQLTQIIEQLGKLKPIDTKKILIDLNSLFSQIQQLSFNPTSPLSRHESTPTEDHDAQTTLSWSSLWNNIKSLITVQHYDQPLKPIINQAQQNTFQQYLLLQVAQGQWAVINHNEGVYQLSLDTINQSLKTLVIPSSERHAIKALIQQLSSQAIDITIPNIGDALNSLMNRLSSPSDTPLPHTKTSTSTTTSSKSITGPNKTSTPIIKHPQTPPKNKKNNPGIEV